MDGFVTDNISTFTGETCRQPRYDEYTHIMTGCTPGQLRCSTASRLSDTRMPGGTRNAFGASRRHLLSKVLTGAISSSGYLHSLVS
jgi:hypothetical protein